MLSAQKARGWRRSLGLLGLLWLTPAVAVFGDDADQRLACKLELVNLLESGDAGYREGFQNYKLRFGAGDWKGTTINATSAWGDGTEGKDLWGYFNGEEALASEIDRDGDGYYYFVYSLKPAGSSKRISAMFRFTLADGSHGVAQAQFAYAGDAPTSAQGTPQSENASAGASLKLQSTLKGHPALVYSVQFTADGKVLVSSSAFASKQNRMDADTVIEWSVPDARKKISIPLDRSITLFGLTSKQIAVGQSDYVGLFDLKTGKAVGRLPGPGKVSPVCVTSCEKADLTAAAFQNGDILVWGNRIKKASPLTLKGHMGAPISLAFSPDGSQLISGGSDNVARLWNAATGKSQHVLKPEGADSPIAVVRYSHDASVVATAGSPARFWDVATGAEKSLIPPEKLYGVRSLVFSPDGSLLATTSVDLQDYKRGKITLWSLKSGKQLAEVSDPDGLVYDVAFSPDGKLLASGGGETVKIWTVVRKTAP